MRNLILNSLLHGFEIQKTRARSGLMSYYRQIVLQLRYFDNGKGIVKEEIPKFSNHSTQQNEGMGGVGLGLHIVYNLVTQQLHGTIICESQPGVGTTFLIYIPLTSCLGATQECKLQLALSTLKCALLPSRRNVGVSEERRRGKHPCHQEETEPGLEERDVARNSFSRIRPRKEFRGTVSEEGRVCFSAMIIIQSVKRLQGMLTFLCLLFLLVFRACSVG